jgi:putative heme-binding domain-containing protein
MDDGKVYTGYVTREAADKVTIRDEKGTEIVINKKNIEQRTKSLISVMPEGLVADLKIIDLASILDYLEDLAKNEKVVPKAKGKK